MVIEKQDDGDEEPRSSLIFRLDPRSGVPTYLQLVHQVEHAIRLGYLSQGDQLPRLKDVVASLSINPNTVQKAYRHLEQQDLIGGRPGQGTFVLASPKTIGLGELNALRKRLVEGWLCDAAACGLDEGGITALFQAALRDFRDRYAGEAAPRQAPQQTPSDRSGEGRERP
jgi:GntR family transcriptional regulator